MVLDGDNTENAKGLLVDDALPGAADAGVTVIDTAVLMFGLPNPFVSVGVVR